jgi:hypothetical protein
MGLHILIAFLQLFLSCQGTLCFLYRETFVYIAHFISAESLDGKSYPLNLNLKIWFQNFKSNYKNGII